MKPVAVTSETFEQEVLRNAEPVVVEFWAAGCGDCEEIDPVLDELADTHEGKIKVARVNVDDQPELAGAFRVTTHPTLYALRDAKVAGHLVGFRGKQAVVQLFEDLIRPGPPVAPLIS